MRRMCGGVLVAAGLGLAVSCVIIDPDAELCAVGGHACACTAGGACDAGLECKEGICIDPNAPSTSGGTDTSSPTSSETDDGSADSADSDPTQTTGNDDVPNIIFVTSSMHSAGSLGGLAGADAICQTRAEAAGLSGTYVAWLSVPDTHAKDRLAGASGWVRPDGTPFARDVAQIVANRFHHPPTLDENGAEVPLMSAVWTGTFDDGAAHDIGENGICGGWTSNDPGTYAWLGSVGAGQYWWTAYFGLTCDTPGHLYCLGIDHQHDLHVEPMQGRYAFASATPISAAQGREAADALCQSEAQAASLSGSFLALMAGPGQAPAARFDLQGAPWVRMDGIPIFHPGEPMGDTLAAPIMFEASGALKQYAMTWAGAPFPTAAGTSEDTCMGWTMAAGPSPLATSFHSRWFNWSLDGGTTAECGEIFDVMCFQE